MMTLIFLSILLLCALCVVIYATRVIPAMRTKRIIAVTLSIVLIGSASFLYYRLGYYQALENAAGLAEFNREAQRGEINQDKLAMLIKGLNAQLKQHPHDPITAALLGKIYFTVGEYPAAEKSFALAYAMLPTDPELLIDYATAYYLARKGEVGTDWVLLDKIKAQPQTLASLSLLANIALDSGDKALAIAYWQQMQAQLPKESPLYQELSEMIE